MTADQKPIRVLFVEDHQLLADALSAMLAREPDMTVVGVAGSVAEAKTMARERVDVVLMDYRLPDGTGAEATRAIKARWPPARVVMLTAIKDDETVLESIQAGADGYLTKDRAADDVVQAVRAAYAGETLLPRSVIVEIARRVAAARERGDDRQIDRAADAARARGPASRSPRASRRRRSASACYIAPNTLRTHVQNIMGKLRVHSKLEAVAFALRYRLVEPPRPGGRRSRPSDGAAGRPSAQLPVQPPTAGAVRPGAAPRVRAARRPAARHRPGGPGLPASWRRIAGPPLLVASLVVRGTRRSAGSVAPRRTAIRAARPCRSGVHTTSRRARHRRPPDRPCSARGAV